MNQAFTTSHKDPLTAAAAAVLFTEDISAIKDKVSKLKVGDKTNFGVVKTISDTSIEFKARDTGVTKISFNQRKMGSKDFILDKLMKLKEEVLDEAVDIAQLKKKAKDLGWDDKVVDDMFKLFMNVPGMSKNDVLGTIKDAIDYRGKKMKKESIDLAEELDIKKVLAYAKKIGGDVSGTTIDFGQGSVIKVSVAGDKIKFDGGKSSGIETFKSTEAAIAALKQGIDEEVQLEEGNMSAIFQAGYDAKLTPAEIANLMKQALKKFNNGPLATKELIFTFNAIAKSKKDFGKFIGDFDSLNKAVYESVEELDEANSNWAADIDSNYKNLVKEYEAYVASLKKRLAAEEKEYGEAGRNDTYGGGPGSHVQRDRIKRLRAELNKAERDLKGLSNPMQRLREDAEELEEGISFDAIAKAKKAGMSDAKIDSFVKIHKANGRTDKEINAMLLTGKGLKEEVEDLSEGVLNSLGFTKANAAINTLESALDPNGNLAKGIAKELGQGYIADFKKAQKHLDEIYNIWEDITMGLSMNEPGKR